MVEQHIKDQFWKEVKKVGINKTPYMLLSYAVYPFIQRSKVREKYNSGNYNGYTLRLWFMLNDDELKRYDVDYDVEYIKKHKPQYNLNTKFGRFRASYYFNVLRNRAYNYSLSHYPIRFLVDHYTILEETINKLTREGKEVSPMYFANWTSGIIGESEVWYDPNREGKVIYGRKSYARVRKVLFFKVKEEYQAGDFGDRLDFKYKWKGLA